MKEQKPYFEVACCGKRRGMAGADVLFCTECDVPPGVRSQVEDPLRPAPEGAWYRYWNGGWK